MNESRFLRNVLLKALALFVLLNLGFAALNPTTAQFSQQIGSISAYNLLFPGRLRFPFGENPARSYNLSLYNLEAMFASHEIAAHTPAAQRADAFRVVVVGDSSVWGTLLRPEQTLSGQLNASGLTLCGRRARFYNLGYPTISLTKDLMVLDLVQRTQPDQIVWLTTLEAFPSDKQLASPIVANNPDSLRQLETRYNLGLSPGDPALAQPDLWQRTIFGQRRALSDWMRLQLYGVLWGATGIDQEYPVRYERAQRDLAQDSTYHGWQPPNLPEDQLAMNVLQAGLSAAGQTPLLLVNEPMLVSTGQNSDLRYNFFYPRWAYDEYRTLLQKTLNGRPYLDLWDLVPEAEFTNSAIHMTPAGEALLAQKIGEALAQQPCR